ncbi:PaaX family transcriptional regulator [Actinocorallia herbida]|uniref:PaaX family transcriptional regulator n=1 Tax=Actinocorallia herbida TaxID=58109 RepID=A0A3N1D3C4_9ACTN|nr:PaaX family transcriptional regulator C-terminal domain-containing protein [Actinocorallia herbida]ROO88034.1 PaaX family transcriptional regulator [Actinocorallia herbida]
MSPDEEITAVPSLSRRQQTGVSSVRSVLLTVFGEYVLPRGSTAWTSTLLHVLAGLNIEEKAARQALNRMAANGWIVAEKSGRRVRWGLTDHGRALLAEGAERIYSFGRDRETWDGRWLVLLASVPESKRELRHQLRNGLTWAGMGSPAQGVWVTPHADREAEVTQIVENLGLADSVSSFCGPFAAMGSERSMVNEAWHLDELAKEYEEFLAEFAGLRPTEGDGTLLAQVRLVDSWRRFPRLDPRLPPDLLPPHWIGLRAANVFEDLHDRWHQAAQARWSELADD